jgi:Reverse transcriptase (RNA-dependent DNA polymerase)
VANPFQTIVDNLDLETTVASRLRPNDLLPPRLEDNVGGELGKRFSAKLHRDLERGRYDPSRAYFVTVPKSRTATRPAALLGLADRVVYEAIVCVLRQRIETYLLGGDVLLWPRGEPSSKKWREFEHSPLLEGATYIVRADISNFYESIDHEQLGSVLLQATGKRPETEALLEFLNWSMHSHRGLPQGLDASDPLASVYLAPVDFAMIRDGYSYARHGDDIRIAVDNYEDARKAVFVLESHVRSLALALNNAKTRIFRRETYEQMLGSKEQTFTQAQAQLMNARIAALEEDSDELGAAIENADLSQLGWDFFYHGRVSLQEVLDELRPKLVPSEVEVAAHLFLETAEKRPGSPGGLDAEDFHQRLSVSLLRLAAAKSPRALPVVGDLLAEFPDKTELFCAYLSALSEQNPTDVAAQAAVPFKQGHFRTEWETAWVVRVFDRLPHLTPKHIVEDLQSMLQAPDGRWLAVVEVLKLLADRGELKREIVNRFWSVCPPVFRADLIEAAAKMVKHDSWAQTFLSAAKDDPIHAVICRHFERSQWSVP